MIKIGVRVHDFGKGSPKDLAIKSKEIGFDGVQLVLNKALEGETGLPGTLRYSKAQDIKACFDSEEQDIFMLGAYFNPVHSNKELVQTNIAKFKEHLKYANEFGALYVGSETGSYNDDKWTYNPRNRTEEAFQEVKAIFKDIVDYAKSVDANVALEGAFGHCMYEPKQLKRLVDEIDNGHLFVTIDIYNYLSIDNYQKQTQIFDECIDLFKDKIVIFHLKDFIIKDNTLSQVGLGKGLMDFDYMLKEIKKSCPDAILIFEGVKKEDMKSSFSFIKKRIK